MTSMVVCDNCSDSRTPAVKTCVKCETSYCEMHLKPHVENPRLRKHVLVAPTGNLDERRCPEHKQELALYCEQDDSLVCTVCSVSGGHVGHRVTPVERVQQTKQEEFRLEKIGRDEMKKVATSRTQQFRGDYKRVQESLRGIKEGISREFERRRQQLTQEEREALRQVDEEGRSVLSRIQANIDHYESKARHLQREINQLLTALTVQDPLSFMQDAVHETLRSSVSHATQDDPAPVSGHMNLAKVISVGGVKTNLLPLLYGRSPTLDPNSAFDKLHISSDRRMVTRTNVSQGRPPHPDRFDYNAQALCSEAFSSGQHYWEVDMGGTGSCRIGVAYGTIPRKGIGAECFLGENDVSWSLRKQDDRCSVRHGGLETSLSVPETPRRIGVHLDWDAGLLSFYSSDPVTLLHTFRQTFTQPLYPALLAGINDGKAVTIVDLSYAS